ncbi:hypothetical protein [Halapricum salinum]|uniref:Uncharacterized protein n=1 Tax=Halapricum salinum TaxID=1457250 RepID=A0A4D6HA33_9EURY|nr:hypothetical protein [Halapricum salinum]QCC50779.1 hypothetical protein DV733_05755 [Halapricum salinum]
MSLGRTIGYGLLALVDAVVATVVAVFLSGFGLLGVAPSAESAVTIALGIGAATFVATLLASTISHYRGGKPFAFTRLSKVVVKYTLFYSPWVVWRRRNQRR